MNNLFGDYKYNKDFLSLIHYKIGYKLYICLSDNNHSNIIISGISKSGKTLLMKTILNDIFYINISTKKELLYDNIYYEKSHIHYYFDLKIINDEVKLLNLIKLIVRNYNYYTNNFNYIILDNYEYLNNVSQNKLKVIFEKSSKTSKFIIITKNYNKILEPIKSRFITIRIPNHSINDKYIYFKKILIKNNIIISDDILYEIIKKHDDIDFNFINILSYIKTNKISNDIYDVIIEKYMNIINNKKTNIIKKITDIKQLIYLSKSVVSDIQYFYKRLLSYLFKLPISDDIKIKLVKEFSDNDIMINKSFRDLLCIEGLFIEIYKILTTTS